LLRDKIISVFLVIANLRQNLAFLRIGAHRCASYRKVLFVVLIGLPHKMMGEGVPFLLLQVES
jgi:hypothetical protein